MRVICKKIVYFSAVSGAKVGLATKSRRSSCRQQEAKMPAAVTMPSTLVEIEPFMGFT